MIGVNVVAFEEPSFSGERTVSELEHDTNPIGVRALPTLLCRDEQLLVVRNARARWACLADDAMQDLVHDLFDEANRLQSGAMELDVDDPRFKERQLRAADAAQKANRLAKQLEERVGEQKQ